MTDTDLYAGNCASCDREYFYHLDENGNEIYEDELYVCSACQETVCSDCSWTLESLLHTGLHNSVKKHIHDEYGHYQEHDIICEACLIARGINFIQQLPLEDLPLYVSSSWEWPEVEEVYKARLSAGK